MRTALTVTAVDPAGNIKRGATIRVYVREDDGTAGDLATCYLEPNGSSQVANPGLTDNFGVARFWLDRGIYVWTAEYAGEESEPEPFDSSPAADGSIDDAWIGGTERPFEYTQAVPSATWTVPHNLGREPVVAVIGTDGHELGVGIRHVDVNTLEVTMVPALACAGKVVCR